jgi:putative component of toxin-antitoxin plasmid stabilization module
VIDVVETLEFADWIDALKDRGARARINARIQRLRSGNPGVDHGSGYRVYLTNRGRTVVILLCGGDKSTQRRDIARAKEMARLV